MSLASERLAEWIERSKLQKQQAARLLGISNGYMSQLLTGKLPSLDMALRIEDQTGITVRSWKLSGLSKTKKESRKQTRKERDLAACKP